MPLRYAIHIPPSAEDRTPALPRRYVIVTVTVLVVVVGLLLSDHATAAQWLASAFALIIALQTSIRMIKDLLRGHWMYLR